MILAVHRLLVTNLCGSFVLCVYASLYVAAALPLLPVLLVALPTPAVMAAELLKTHAQRRNSFPRSLSRGDVIVPDGTVALRHAGRLARFVCQSYDEDIHVSS